jgi:hypothetical protein
MVWAWLVMPRLQSLQPLGMIMQAEVVCCAATLTRVCWESLLVSNQACAVIACGPRDYWASLG